ncbi:ethanolamine utilization protein [Rhodococcus pyridinivorans SB3094]|uniref:Ethanolamine utilization protein n=1 Tax=Rhodococcus pyridinivorans SB3094 TaxID=1435356 RepID=V9XBG0_9NOCA|nr:MULTISPECIES: ethanolamine utilization protein [Rhodococcus]AHD19315.1 ethanolamine utilization protein [Rhodococcus pyridinivorans SB3094]MCT7290079.1 ethanolamine utilization protein [Rhodococcus sp. PAE-6]
MSETITVPAFRVTSGFWKNLPQMSVDEFPGTKGYIDDVHPNPEGCPMASGYFRLEPTEAPLDYTYEYDEMKVVLDGEFRLENLDTGQVEIARAYDAIFFPKGSRIRFTTPEGALAFYVGLRSFAP